MKKILFLNGGNLGGAEMMTILYAKILSNAGYKCKILTHIFPGKSDQTAALIPKKISQETVKCKWRYYLIYVYYQIWRYQPDIIFTYELNCLKYILSPIRKYHISPSFKMVGRCANTPSKVSEKCCKDMKALNTSDIVISQTNEMQDELKSIVGVDPEKIITIYNPVNKERIKEGILETYNFDKSYINYVAVARITKQKDYSTMIDAFALVLKSQPNSRLYICGDMRDITLSKSLIETVEKNGLSDNVFFEGFQPNPYKYLVQADAFVLSSIYEGLPNAMLDAMYLGIPVAATECIPYIPQVVSEGVNGYTCRVRDANGLAKAMLRAVKVKNLPKYVDVNNSEEKIINLFNTLCI